MRTTREVGFNVGDAAEDIFKAWCSQANILATPPDRDRRGWDFHLALPRTDRVDPLDAPPSLVCYVQVKGHLGTDPASPAIGLSNWNEMIRQPWPWFICVILLDADARPTRSALIHVDETLVCKARKRIWENAATEKRPLHELSMSVPWSDESCLPTLHGRELLSTLRRQIGDDFRRYCDEKTRWYEEAGIEGGLHRLNIKLADDVSEQDMCDFALGKRKSLGAKRIETAEVRFGIKLPRETFTDTEIQIPSSRSVGITTLKIKNSKPPRGTVELQCETLISTSIFPMLSDEFQRVRLVAPIVSAELSRRPPHGMTAHWSFNIGAGEQARLSDLERGARAIRALLEQPLEVKALLPEHAEETVLPAPEAQEGRAEPSLMELLEVACNAAVVARAFGLDLDAMRVTPEDLIDEAQKLKLMASIHSGNSIQLEVSFCDSAEKLEKYAGRVVTRVAAMDVQLGDRYLLLCFTMGGTTRASDDGMGLEVVNPRLEVAEKLVIDITKTTEAEADQELAAMLRRAREEREREGQLLLREKGDPD